VDAVVCVEEGQGGEVGGREFGVCGWILSGTWREQGGVGGGVVVAAMACIIRMAHGHTSDAFVSNYKSNQNKT
jgi:hypothetical protein